MLGLLLGVVLGALLVDKVEPLGLGQPVDLEAGGGGQHLLGQAVVDRLALLALLVLPQAHALEGGGAADQLVGQLRLVRLAVVDLVAGLLCFAWGMGVRVMVESEVVRERWGLPNPNIVMVL